MAIASQAGLDPVTDAVGVALHNLGTAADIASTVIDCTVAGNNNGWSLAGLGSSPGRQAIRPPVGQVPVRGPGRGWEQ